jgi:FlaA1/EpsC-like NDP-sugar epimerase
MGLIYDGRRFERPPIVGQLTVRNRLFNFMTILERIWNTHPAARRMAIVAIHAGLWSLALALAFVLRFDGFAMAPADAHYLTTLPAAMAMLVACRTIAFAGMGLFRGIWRYVGMAELKSLALANLAGTLGFALAGIMVKSSQVPRSLYVGELLTAFLLTGGARFVLRLFRERSAGRVSKNAVRSLIIGAGDAGDSLLRDLQRSESEWAVVGLLDDDPRKAGAKVRGVKVLGTADESTLRRVVEVHGVKLVVLALPSASGKRIREILRLCRTLGVQAKTLPALADRLGGQISAGSIREVAIEDLLRRDPVELDIGQVNDLLENKTVLVTGAGGSIGSELCRQVLKFKPRKLVLFEHDENALFDIERELATQIEAQVANGVPEAMLVAAMGDITDALRVESVFTRERPNVVLHAAAHKHVSMMEANPSEAVKNNVFGTQTVAEAAHKHRAETFVLISTDKAVNPTSVMGASKRVAEMILQERAKDSSTRFAAVRFGNVLGSAGSVVPLFREQIRKGGPVRITHPDVTRYFMTIPEASQLVLQAGALGGTGEIFVLDMGQPVKILNLARDLIELSGLRPDIDIQVEFTGLRPGEKLFEELLYESEVFAKTPHPKILVGKIQPTDERILLPTLALIRERAMVGADADTRELLSALVPEATLGQAVPAVPKERPGLRPVESSTDLSVLDRTSDVAIA